MAEAGLERVGITDIAPINELKGWAALAIQAQIIPSNMNMYQAMAIVQAGKEMGLQPLQSLRSMSFIKGRLTMSVQLQLAMAKNRGVTMDDPDEGEGYCQVTLHRNKESVTCKYTKEDAKKAGLISSGGSWDKYERQMLRWRSIGDALRLIAPDMTMNLLSPEEAASIEPLTPLSVEALKELAPAPRTVATASPPTTEPKAAPASAPPTASTEKKDDATLRHELQELAAIAEEAGLYPTVADAIYFATSYTTKDGKDAGYKDVLKLKGWQMSKAIEKLNARLNALPARVDSEDDQDIDV